jgi:hypothetical protein
VSRRNFDGLKTPNPSSFGHRVCLGKKVEAKNPNGVSAKCAIGNSQKAEVAWLEEMGYAYEELDVRDFVGGRF